MAEEIPPSDEEDNELKESDMVIDTETDPMYMKAREEWMSKVANIHTPKKEINEMIMNYLLVEGDKATATAFAKELGTTEEMQEELLVLDYRKTCEQSILEGQIQHAIDTLRKWQPEILTNNQQAILFRLHKQQLLELMKQNLHIQALEYAQTHCQGFLGAYQTELEDILSLLVYPVPSESPMKSLFSLIQRHETAKEVDQAILRYLKRSERPMLETMIKQMIWTQDHIAKRNPYQPIIRDIKRARLEFP